MADAPKSYKDPYYDTLDARVSSKLGLPEGLLAGIRLNGERSNADQVSEAGARTVYQIIPQTREAAIKKWGIDPYLNPENAAEVSGLLLKDSLARNNGDAAQATAEYHGGTSRDNWGPRTRSYVNRVMVGLRSQQQARPANRSESTFDRLTASQQQSQTPQIAQVFAAYQNGQMTPEERAEFEGDVRSGLVMLPQGAQLTPANPAQSAGQLPDAVVQAFLSGRMSPQERTELEQDVKAGLVSLPSGVSIDMSSQIPTEPGANTTPAAQPSPSLGDQLLGLGETGLALATGATTGALGALTGAAGGIARSIGDGTFGTQEGVRNIQSSSEQGAANLTYAPRTQAGQDMTGAAGEALAATLPVAPLTGELQALARAGAAAQPTAAAAATMARPVAGAAAQTVRNAGQAAAGRVAQVFGREPAEAAATAGTKPSIGAAGVDAATVRRAAAQELPVPVELTRGQAERTFEQQRFERETAKNPTAGAPLRERYQEQNQAILRNFDAWLDETGAEAPTLRAVGDAVDRALVEKSRRDKTEVRAKYARALASEEADIAPDLSRPVNIGLGDEVVTSTPFGFINEQPAGLPSNALTDAARQYAVRRGIADLVDGELVPREGVTVRQLENWRKDISGATGYDPVAIRQSTILKRLIDGQTEPVAGPLYRQARRARELYARQYENRAVISDLLGTKRGTQDRRVALEDVFDRTILRSSLDDVRFVRRVLQTGGENGQQAWRELQGATLNYIREQATKNVQRDTAGNVIVSPAGLDKAIRQLQEDGKLDFIFGKRGSEQLGVLNDLAKVIYTAPPGAINTSNTASVILAAFDGGLMAGTGFAVPVPVATAMRAIASRIRDKRLQKRVDDALGRNQPAQQTPRNSF